MPAACRPQRRVICQFNKHRLSLEDVSEAALDQRLVTLAGSQAGLGTVTWPAKESRQAGCRPSVGVGARSGVPGCSHVASTSTSKPSFLAQMRHLPQGATCVEMYQPRRAHQRQRPAMPRHGCTCQVTHGSMTTGATLHVDPLLLSCLQPSVLQIICFVSYAHATSWHM